MRDLRSFPILMRWDEMQPRRHGAYLAGRENIEEWKLYKRVARLPRYAHEHFQVVQKQDAV